MERGERIDEVDIAKGIGILLVVIGHSIPDANIGIQNLWGGWPLSGFIPSIWRFLWQWPGFYFGIR